MKTGIHPEMYDVVFIDSSTGKQFITQSTTKTEEKMKINGKEYFVIKVEISSDSHPFYTGKQKLIDTAGRVDKFMAKMKKAQDLAAKNVKNVDEDDDEDEEKVVEEKAEEPKKETKKEEEAAEAPVQTSIEDASEDDEKTEEEATEETAEETSVEKEEK
jgi:large subunit ribosomal protein L31